jgi:hypothetical protein
MNNLSSPDLSNNLHIAKIWCCGHPVRTGMPQDFRGKKLNLKQGDIWTGVMGDLIEVYEG